MTKNKEYIDIKGYIFEPVRESTKRGAAMASELNMCYVKQSIYQKYRNPSCDKVAAWRRCQKICEELGGEGLVITGGNCYSFSAAFRLNYNGWPAVIYFTREHNYIIL